MTDPMQATINRLSLVMTIPEDIVKVLRKADFPPNVVEIFLRLHHQQVEIEKAINGIRENNLQMATIINQLADNALSQKALADALSKKVGFDPNEIVNAEDVTGSEF